MTAQKKSDESQRPHNEEAYGSDGRADALSAVGLILFAVVAAVFWVNGQ